MSTGVVASTRVVTDDQPSHDEVHPDRGWGLGLDDGELLEELEISARHQRQLMAHQTVLIGEIMRRKLYQPGGHASVFGLFRAKLGWSEGECGDAVAAVHAGQISPSLAAAIDHADLPVSHSAVLAHAVTAAAKSPPPR